MVVCLCPDAGLFVRINTRGWRSGRVPIAKREHPFLDHDSQIECAGVFELDDYIIEQAMTPPGRGIIGRIAASLVPSLLAAIAAAPTLRDEDKAAIRDALSVS